MRLTAAARMKQAPAAKSARLTGMILKAMAILKRIPSVLKTTAAVFALSFVKVDLLFLFRVQGSKFKV
jgi:hypothetical protein